MKQAQDKGASSWLTALPLEEMGFTLNKEEFRDALRLRYNLKLEDLPTWCACGQRFDVVHALSCKKGGFVAERHDNVKNILTKLLTKVCRDVKSEPRLIPINGESFDLQQTGQMKLAWTSRQKAFGKEGRQRFLMSESHTSMLVIRLVNRRKRSSEVTRWPRNENISKESSM